MDLITLEVLRNKFDVIADEMEMALLKSAYSSIVKEGMDASAALFTIGGETIAQAASIPIHLGSLVPAVQRILQAFPAPTMAEGDVYIMNDPYDGGSHLPDIVIVVPILYQGHTVALSTTMTHNQDVGGKTPGSVPTDATEIFQEGLRLPKRVLTLHEGERLHVDTPGGGGYGDPLERAPEAVRQDVCDRRVTVPMARTQYGVVMHEPSFTVDQEATQSLRAALRTQCGRA